MKRIEGSGPSHGRARWLSALCLVAACDGTSSNPKAPVAAPAQAQVVAAPESDLFRVPIGDSPVRGRPDAKVTLVLFSDFQCPFCSRAEKTVDELARTYGDDLRVVFKHRPLPFHARAMPAALAVEAARDQGHFWEMHDRLFAAQGALGDAELEAHAQALGLDVARWKAALASPALSARIAADAQLADRLHVDGTPTLFFNGHKLEGAQPLARMKAAVDAELKKADGKLALGVARAALYDDLTAHGLTDAPAPAPRAADKAPSACPTGGCKGAAAKAAGPVADAQRVEVALGRAPARGSGDAPITVVVFSDFQCPYCGRAEPTLRQLEQSYPGKIKIVWKNFPLEFHAQARPAALAALAADAQGKFWAMHDKVMENQQALGDADLERYAGEVGLDVSRWRADRASPALVAALDADLRQGTTLGVEGTPTMFINGRKVAGAYPLAALRTVVDEELARGGAGGKL